MKSLNVERQTKNQASSVPDHARPSLITVVRPRPRRASAEGEMTCPWGFAHKGERCYAVKGRQGAGWPKVNKAESFASAPQHTVPHSDMFSPEYSP